MITEPDHDWLMTYCPDCEWGYAATDMDAAKDAYEDHLRRRHERHASLP